MNDEFNRLLLTLAKDSPDIQQALFKNAREAAESGYSIPTGDIHLDIFKDGEPHAKLLAALKKADQLTVAQLDKILRELRAALTIKEVTGEALLPYEKTLKDIDISCLATFALVTWAKTIQHTGE